MLSDGSVSCDLWHRRLHRVASLYIFFKIDSLVDHPVRGLFPAQYLLRRPTRGALAAHSLNLGFVHSRDAKVYKWAVFSLLCSILCSIVEWVA